MKERLRSVLAWIAFTNAVILVAGSLLVLVGVTTNDFGVLGERVPAYMAMYVRNDIYAVMLSPAVWILLFVWTGSARILPWKQVTNDD